jgi:hypothetical protein
MVFYMAYYCQYHKSYKKVMQKIMLQYFPGGTENTLGISSAS